MIYPVKRNFFDKEAKCPENDQLLDDIWSPVHILIETLMYMYECTYYMHTVTCIHILHIL